MIITYHGEQCVRCQSGELSLVVDPQNNRFKSDITLRTEAPASPSFLGEAREIMHAGEYEIRDISVKGIQIGGSEKILHTIYVVEWEGLHLVFLGGIEKTLGVDTLDEIGEVEVLFLGVGSEYMPEKEAAALVKKLSPSVVIPFFKKSAPEFMKLMDQKPSLQEKFVFKAKDLAPESQTVILLEEK